MTEEVVSDPAARRSNVVLLEPFSALNILREAVEVAVGNRSASKGNAESEGSRKVAELVVRWGELELSSQASTRAEKSTDSSSW